MNGAYEFYDYGDLIFGLESSSSIHFTEKSRDNINNKYLEEMKRRADEATDNKYLEDMKKRADEATRKGFTDKLSERIKDLNEELNTKAIGNMVLYFDGKPIKLKEVMFENMKGTADALNKSSISAVENPIDVAGVDPTKLNDSVSAAFSSSNMNTGFEMPTSSEYNASSSNNSLMEPPANSLVEEQIPDALNKSSISAVKTNPIDVAGADSTKLNDSVSAEFSSSNMNAGFEMPTSSEYSASSSNNSLMEPSADSLVEGQTPDAYGFFRPSVDSLVTNQMPNGAGKSVVSNNSDFSNDTAIPGVDALAGNEFSSSEGNSDEMPPLKAIINDDHSSDDNDKIGLTSFVDSNLNSGDVVASTEGTNDSSVDLENVGNNSSQTESSENDSEIHDNTFDENPVDVIPDDSVDVPKDIARGEDVQVVPERKDTSMSADIGYANNDVDSQMNQGFAEEASDDVRDSLIDVSADSIFDVNQSKDTNKSKSVDSSRVVDPDLGELIGYSKPEGELKFDSLVPDLIKQYDETNRIGSELTDRINEQGRKKRELERKKAEQDKTKEELVGRLYNLTALKARNNAEKQETIDYNDEELALIEETIRGNDSTIATLRQMLGETDDDVSEDDNTKGRSM